MKHLATTIVMGLTTLAATTADAQECRIAVLHPVKDDMSASWQPGQTLPVDIARGDGSARRFCAHGGACLPGMTHGMKAVRLTNCRVGMSLGGGDYKLVPDPRTMGAADAAHATLRDRTEERLSAMNLSNASAGTFADDYVNRPASPNGQLVAKALAGSKAARAALRAKLP